MTSTEGHFHILGPTDMHHVERLVHNSDYVYQRFTLSELPQLLQHGLAIGFFHQKSLLSFILIQFTSQQIAWICGFGVSWGLSKRYGTLFHELLRLSLPHLRNHQITELYYSGNDEPNDWLRSQLLAARFYPYEQLYSYDKYDFEIPRSGNAEVTIRPVRVEGAANDLVALIKIETDAFEPCWRYNADAFVDIAKTHPYFMVAVCDQQVIGYQFNMVDGESGYLIRIAVASSHYGRGIGTRLLAEAVRYFQEAGTDRILLNTTEGNKQAHRLYEQFGFIRLAQKGFVLRYDLS